MHFHILIANFAIAVSTACRFLKKIVPTMTKKKHTNNIKLILTSVGHGLKRMP
jgi:hypothetical protein